MPFICIRCLGSNGNYQLGLNHDEDIDIPETTLRCYIRPEFVSQVDKTFLHRQESNLSRESMEDCDLHRLGFTSGSVFPVKIACGGNHTVILLSNGAVIGTGLNEQGQLILDSKVPENKVLKFWRVIYDDPTHPAIDLACCWESTVVAVLNQPHTTGGDFKSINIKSFGTGMKGELGLGNSTTFNADHLRNVLELKNSSKISLLSSMANVIVLDKQAKMCYGWGNNTKNQLLVPNANSHSPANTDKLSRKRTKIVWEPVQIDVVAEFDDCLYSLGKDFLAWISRENTDLTFEASGSLDVQLSSQKVSKSKVDSILSANSNFQISKMEGMWSSVHIISKQKNDTVKLTSLGKGRHGQLSMNGRLLQQYKDFSCGSEHGIFCNKKNEVYCWGWGEHGNCGMRNPELMPDGHRGKITQDTTVWENLNLFFALRVKNTYCLFREVVLPVSLLALHRNSKTS
ncbi:hypothetical protein ACO0QE_003213 [Hanseniaspora vineae]